MRGIVYRSVSSVLAFAGIAAAQADDIGEIKAWVGRYPNEQIRGVRFFDHPGIAQQIHRGLGDEALPKIRSMTTVGPVIQRLNWVIAYGCDSAKCSSSKWWLAIDLNSFELRGCLTSVDSNTVRFGSSERSFVDIPRNDQNACLQPEKTIARFDDLFGVGNPSRQTVTTFPSKSNTSSRISVTQNGGTFGVQTEVNEALRLHFVIDSGASDVSIPLDVFSTLVRSGTIKPSDLLGERTYLLADGSKTTSMTFVIRSLKVGDQKVENVLASVSPVGGSLLLGQSFLGRFRSWSIDNKRRELVLDEH